MDCRRARHIIRPISILIFLWSMVVMSPAFCQMESPSISVSTEGKHWLNWSAENPRGESPLQPIISTHSQNIALEFDRVIAGLPSHENAALLAVVNIDNGIFQLAYVAWGQEKSPVQYVEAGTGKKKTVVKQSAATTTNITRDLERLMLKQQFIDVDNYKTLDASSVYLVIRRGEVVKRFAAYAPSVPLSGSSRENLKRIVKYFINHEQR